VDEATTQNVIRPTERKQQSDKHHPSADILTRLRLPKNGVIIICGYARAQHCAAHSANNNLTTWFRENPGKSRQIRENPGKSGKIQKYPEIFGNIAD